jgi:S-adenosylmethionine decarboxylase
MEIGNVWIGDYYEVSFPPLTDVKILENIFIQACEKADFTILEIQSERFESGGKGVTLLLSLAESHLAVHTWPEYQYMSVTLDSCLAEEESMKAINHINDNIKANSYKIRTVDRTIPE